MEDPNARRNAHEQAGRAGHCLLFFSGLFFGVENTSDNDDTDGCLRLAAAEEVVKIAMATFPPLSIYVSRVFSFWRPFSPFPVSRAFPDVISLVSRRLLLIVPFPRHFRCAFIHSLCSSFPSFPFSARVSSFLCCFPLPFSAREFMLCFSLPLFARFVSLSLNSVTLAFSGLDVSCKSVPHNCFFFGALLALFLALGSFVRFVSFIYWIALFLIETIDPKLKPFAS